MSVATTTTTRRRRRRTGATLGAAARVLPLFLVVFLAAALVGRCSAAKTKKKEATAAASGTATPAAAGASNGWNWIDVDTPEDKKTTKSFIDGTVYELVMSDEFNVPNRTFTDGHDPLWTALDKSDDDSSAAGGGSLHFYNSTHITTTEDGYLKISTTIDKTEWDRFDHVKQEWKHEVKNFKSGMLQGWNKFCFTGGIVEVDVIFPGKGYIAGLWPAVWLLGNLGRATYEASTNNIWPWSYDKCNRELQSAQKISACNAQNHFGMNKYQGRGATEIDIIEVMYGEAGDLPNTHPPISLPYADLTLQVAPGVMHNRPKSGSQPIRSVKNSHGFPTIVESTWYKGLETSGNTSLNPFFYGTFLAETKPGEPVTRNKKQAFQADAVGTMSQFVESHFTHVHTYRLEWQPGPGGRIDWFMQGQKVNETFTKVGDGSGKDWYKAFTIKDKSLDLMGSQVPNEPQYLIFNTAISTNWGFPYSTPAWCKACYDCNDPKCACNFPEGFCNLMGKGNVAMYVDSVRLYQSRNASAHVGNEHTLGCDPPEYPTRGWIKGQEYQYSRAPPFSYDDTGPLREKIQRGGARCDTDADCGAEVAGDGGPRGTCGEGIVFDDSKKTGWSRIARPKHGKVCKCNDGFTGPHCLALDHKDTFPSAVLLTRRKNIFEDVARLYIPPFMLIGLLVLLIVLIFIVGVTGRNEKKRYAAYTEMKPPGSPERPPVITAPVDGTNIGLGRPVHVRDI